MYIHVYTCSYSSGFYVGITDPLTMHHLHEDPEILRVFLKAPAPCAMRGCRSPEVWMAVTMYCEHIHLLCLCAYVCSSIHIYIYMYVCRCTVYMHINIYIYTYTDNSRKYIFIIDIDKWVIF